ncbi:MAG: HAD family hydrolase [Ruminococcaceae bacterium]|nr:HAD family hydrolase [Oscillospiraceae bacterium]
MEMRKATPEKKTAMQKKKIDLILYDLDGTIQDSVPLIVESFQKAYEIVLGECTRSEADLKSYIGRPLRDSFERHDKETADKLTEAYLSYNLKRMMEGAISLFPGIKESLAKIQSLGYRQGIVTAKRRDSAMVTIEQLDIKKYFDTMVFGEDTARSKPYGDPIVEGARRLGTDDMSRVLYVGDAASDLLSARDCGASFALVDWTMMPKDEIGKLGPDFVLFSLDEIPCIIGNAEL